MHVRAGKHSRAGKQASKQASNQAGKQASISEGEAKQGPKNIPDKRPPKRWSQDQRAHRAEVHIHLVALFGIDGFGLLEKAPVRSAVLGRRVVIGAVRADPQRVEIKIRIEDAWQWWVGRR